MQALAAPQPGVGLLGRPRGDVRPYWHGLRSLKLALSVALDVGQCQRH